MIEIYLIPVMLLVLATILVPAFAHGGTRHGFFVIVLMIAAIAAAIGAFWAFSWAWERFPKMARVISFGLTALAYGFVSFLLLCIVLSALVYTVLSVGPSTMDRLTLGAAILALPLGGVIAADVVPSLRRALWASVIGVLSWALIFFGFFLASTLLFEAALQRHFGPVMMVEFAVALLVGAAAGFAYWTGRTAAS